MVCSSSSRIAPRTVAAMCAFFALPHAVAQWQDGKLNVVFPASVALTQPIYPMPTWSQR